jgi:GDP-L-fucose synthase
MVFPLAGKRVFVAGNRGMVGAALIRRLATEECEVLVADRTQADLMDQASTRALLMAMRPDAVIIAAAKVGGILANDSWPADFLYNNLMIAANLVEASHRADVNRLLFLGSSCIYPKFAAQPIVEEAMLEGALEPTNQWYAIAKIAGIKLAQAYRKQHGRDYISAMPTNLYGPGDNFDLTSSHVIPALMRKVHELRVAEGPALSVWGSGAPRREFLHVDDCADACVTLLRDYSDDIHVNVGSGEDLTIKDLAKLICEVIGYNGTIEFDSSRPDGTPRKLMSIERLRAMGWSPRTPLREGLARTYAWMLENPQMRGIAA